MTLLFGKKRVMVPENGFTFWKEKSYGSCEWLHFLERKELWFLRMASLFGKKRVMVPENGSTFWKEKSYGSWEWLHFLETRVMVGSWYWHHFLRTKKLWFLRMASFFGNDKSYGFWEWLPNLWRRKEKETKKNIMKWSEWVSDCCLTSTIFQLYHG